MRIPTRLFAVPIEVETYSGRDAYGDQFAPPVTVLGHISGGRTVQSSSTGDEVVTALRVMLPNPARLADGSGTVDPVEVLTPESRVASGSVSGTVGSVEPHIKPGTERVLYLSAELT